ncbi:MAG: hypothetical protein CM15mP36_12830 [Flavobacteriales bacterium]|nr:MAG: hypothetical protein CM15mP36_12830 [Flavobacteriales bacterium]
MIAFTAPITFISKSFLKSFRVKVEMGFKLILPGQYIRQSRLSISGYSWKGHQILCEQSFDAESLVYFYLSR